MKSQITSITKLPRYWVAIALYLLVIISSKNQAFAGLQIITSNTVQRGAICSTNLVVTKFQTNNVRVDTGSALSTIVLPDHSAQVQLFHQTRTYRWIATNPSTETNLPTFFTAPAGVTALNDSPARLFSWTNGTEHGRIWVVPTEKFFKSSTKSHAAKTPPVITGNPGIGALFDTNSIIAKTERFSINPVPVSIVERESVGNPTTPFTNVEFKETSELISMTQTNFSPSEFEIPGDYKEAPQQYQVNPAAFGQATTGAGNLDGLRQDFNQGKPVLVPPPYFR